MINNTGVNMSEKIARMVRRTTRKKIDALKAQELQVVKTWLCAVSRWSFKDRFNIAWNILFWRHK
jgi:hypothetical protein